MKGPSAFMLTAAATAQVAQAHYFFESLVTDGAAGQPFEFIREFTRETNFNPIKFSSNPAEDIRDDSTADGDDIICNQGAFSNAGNTGVLEIAAGSDVTVKLGVGAAMEHPGPGLVYMSAAPNGDVTSYSGEGEWFKIFEEGVCNEGGDFTTDAWCTWGRDTMTATIPTDTPDGEYLMRFEHIGVHRSHVNQPEHYVSCVQLKVTGGGSGTPGPTFTLPGGYTDADDYANMNIYNGIVPFTMPGPAVWGGGDSGDGASPAPAQPSGAVPDAGDDSEDTEDSNDAPAPAPAPEAPDAGNDSGFPGYGGDDSNDAPAPAPEETGDAPAPDAGNGGDSCAAIFQQCGGNNHDGPTCCSAGTCQEINEWYHQCAN